MAATAAAPETATTGFEEISVPGSLGTPWALGERGEGWAALALGNRLTVIRRARELMASRSASLARAIATTLERTEADTLAAEVLPLLAAMRYLEWDAKKVLRTRRVGVQGRPLWLGRVTSEVERVPLGRVLVIAVSNYPLLLPGVQVMQALVAGNAVIWKPGRGGAAIALLVAAVLAEAGLPDGALAVTDESVAAGQARIEANGSAGVDKIFFTGSAGAGRDVLRRAAERVVPCVVELSGADAAIVLPSADVAYAARAIGFGLRLNGSATCMAPRRLLLVDAGPDRRLAMLEAMWGEVQAIGPVRVPQAQTRLAMELLNEAQAQGATVLGGGIDDAGRFLPALVLEGRPEMRVAQTDLFAPVLTVIEVRGWDGVRAAQEVCPLALTASIFCGTGQSDVMEAQRLARTLKVGHVTINDLIVATADPRVPFSGRKQSGFGATRGAEGLLEMTVPRVIAVQRGRSERRYERTGAAHVGLFAGLAALLYGGAMRTRARGLGQVVESGRAVARAEKATKPEEREKAMATAKYRGLSTTPREEAARLRSR